MTTDPNINLSHCLASWGGVRAVPLGRYQGRPVYRIPVRVRLNDSRLCATVAEYLVEVVAHSAADAANFVADDLRHQPETEIEARGPTGGRVQRYISWESSVGELMFERHRAPEQLSF